MREITGYWNNSQNKGVPNFFTNVIQKQQDETKHTEDFMIRFDFRCINATFKHRI